MAQYVQPSLTGINDRGLSTPWHSAVLLRQLVGPAQMACFPPRQDFLQVTKCLLGNSQRERQVGCHVPPDPLAGALAWGLTAGGTVHRAAAVLRSKVPSDPEPSLKPTPLGEHRLVPQNVWPALHGMELGSCPREGLSVSVSTGHWSHGKRHCDTSMPVSRDIKYLSLYLFATSISLLVNCSHTLPP